MHKQNKNAKKKTHMQEVIFLPIINITFTIMCVVYAPMQPVIMKSKQKQLTKKKYTELASSF